MALTTRIRCALTAHEWRQWSSWSHAGRGTFVRTRDCARCGARTSERDG